MKSSTDVTISENDEMDLNRPFNIGLACTSGLNGAVGQQPAVIIAGSGGGTKIMTYAELDDRSSRFARVLADAGIGFGDPVLIWLPNCAEFPVVFFGALKLGAIAVPCAAQLTAVEMQFLATDSGARALITSRALLQRLTEDAFDAELLVATWLVADDPNEDPSYPQGQSLDKALDAVSSQNPLTWPCTTKASDPAYLVYTSGTTGFPKGVVHAHRALLGRLPAARHWFHYSDNVTDKILHTGKFNWTYVLGTGLMDPLFLGKTVIVYEGQADASVWPGLIAKHGATIFIGVPTLYRQILQKTEFGAADVPSLRHCMSAGEHLSDQMLEAWQARFGQPIYEAIGMSECSYYLSHHPSQPIKPGSAGRPQPGHRVELLDEQLQPVADNEEGMLCIHRRDLGLFKEYWRAPELTAEVMSGDYFLTGDYARRDADGYFWFLGRKDDMINSFGYRISPIEVERVIKAQADVEDCVVLEESVGPGKNIVTACIIAKRDSNLTGKEVIEYASEQLASYKVPKRVVFLSDFPRTTNGKVMRTVLRGELRGKLR